MVFEKAGMKEKIISKPAKENNPSAR